MYKRSCTTYARRLYRSAARPLSEQNCGGCLAVRRGLTLQNCGVCLAVRMLHGPTSLTGGNINAPSAVGKSKPACREKMAQERYHSTGPTDTEPQSPNLVLNGFGRLTFVHCQPGTVQRFYPFSRANKVNQITMR